MSSNRYHCSFGLPHLLNCAFLAGRVFVRRFRYSLRAMPTAIIVCSQPRPYFLAIRNCRQLRPKYNLSIIQLFFFGVPCNPVFVCGLFRSEIIRSLIERCYQVQKFVIKPSLLLNIEGSQRMKHISNHGGHFLQLLSVKDGQDQFWSDIITHLVRRNVIDLFPCGEELLIVFDIHRSPSANAQPEKASFVQDVKSYL